MKPACAALSVGLAVLVPAAFTARGLAALPRPAPGASQEAARAEDAPVAARFDLPPGAAAEAVARVTPDLEPAATPTDLGRAGRVPALPADAWTRAETWDAWATLLASERALGSTAGGAKSSDAASSATAATSASSATGTADATARAERRARLALLALDHGRTEDAWVHLAATTPAWTAALLPRFLPGVPGDSPIGRGGATGALAADVVLAPALPPPSAERVAGRVDRRAMTTRTVRIGESTVSMRVAVEAEGVQIDVRHVAGPPARFSVRIPRSPDYAYGDEYVDWYRQDAQGVPHALEVKPGEEEHTLYARFDTRRETAAAGLPRALPAGLARGGLWLLVPEGAPDAAVVAAAARAIERVGLGFTCGVRAPGAPSSGLSGTTVDLADAATRADKLAWLVSAVEHFTLAR